MELHPLIHPSIHSVGRLGLLFAPLCCPPIRFGSIRLRRRLVASRPDELSLVLPPIHPPNTFLAISSTWSSRTAATAASDQQSTTYGQASVRLLLRSRSSSSSSSSSDSSSPPPLLLLFERTSLSIRCSAVRFDRPLDSRSIRVPRSSFDRVIAVRSSLCSVRQHSRSTEG